MPSLGALDEAPSSIRWAVVVHALLALGCVAALGMRAPSIVGVHPALKPLKFAISIALFLGTMGLLLPRLTLAPWTRELLAWLLVTTMAAEIIVIVGQALRGTTSHFNVHGPANSAAWSAMVLAIVLATVAMATIAIIASTRPLLDADTKPIPPLVALAWRAGLWLLLLSPISGFAMGGLKRHSVGGPDGGPGLRFTNWSVTHGDLRVAHFFALHALQVLPMLAWLLLRLGVSPRMSHAALTLVIAGATALCVGTLIQAFASRPFLRA